MISRSVVIGTTGCFSLAPIPLANGMLGGLKASSLPVGQPFSLGSHHLPGRQRERNVSCKSELRVSWGKPHSCAEEARGHRRDPHPSARNPPPLPGWSILQRASSRPLAAGKRHPEAPFHCMFPAALIDARSSPNVDVAATSAVRGG